MLPSVQRKAHRVLFAVLHFLRFHPEVGRDARFQRLPRFLQAACMNQEDEADFESFHGFLRYGQTVSPSLERIEIGLSR